VTPTDLAVMRRTDELHLDYPFAGSRMLRDLLRGAGVEIGRGRVATMMKRMGIAALYRRPNTSKLAPGTRSIRIFCASWPLSGRTRCGRLATQALSSAVARGRRHQGPVGVCMPVEMGRTL
jgi:hypothetical protein